MFTWRRDDTQIREISTEQLEHNAEARDSQQEKERGDRKRTRDRMAGRLTGERRRERRENIFTVLPDVERVEFA
jgi:hypothetical protein